MNLKEKTAGYFILGLMIISLLADAVYQYFVYTEMSDFSNGRIPNAWVIITLVTMIIFGVPSILIGVFSLHSFVGKRRMLQIPLAISAILFAYSALSSISSFLTIRKQQPEFADLQTMNFFSIIYRILMIVLFVVLFVYYQSTSVKRVVALIISAATLLVSMIRWINMVVNLTSAKADVYYFLVSTVTTFAFPTAILLLILFIRPDHNTKTQLNVEGS